MHEGIFLTSIPCNIVLLYNQNFVETDTATPHLDSKKDI